MISFNIENLIKDIAVDVSVSQTKNFLCVKEPFSFQSSFFLKKMTLKDRAQWKWIIFSITEQKRCIINQEIFNMPEFRRRWENIE